MPLFLSPEARVDFRGDGVLFEPTVVSGPDSGETVSTIPPFCATQSKDALKGGVSWSWPIRLDATAFIEVLGAW